ncbi:uncharacterized protein cubi_01466 [Cryptosporidium ubiquitum]|uniref:Phospholipase/carboxylesterase/thioesterase domain-containing protein n=1 Tax=Cryptosporidium ubiquitum TaxID=857276 RepID=A0A1J4MH10_9CRYT|nr:uncharacterized protein cubi_01466 [Cryptosporidium ubiquitum]OII72133.1 hypothetical protein cubi_01466 [Cryptosporidium ubiquitum]
MKIFIFNSSGIKIFNILFLLLLINYIVPEVNGKSAYTDIIEDDYSYLVRSKINKVERPIDILLHLSRSKTPKYTVVLYNVYYTIKVIKKLSTSMYVHLVRHLDHYDREFSDNVQFIIPNFYPNVGSIISSLGRKARASLISGTLPEEKYIQTAVASISFINNAIRRGVIPSHQTTAFYGNCVGGLIASATSVALKESIAAVVLNGSSLFMPDLVRRRLARKTALKYVKYLLIHSYNDNDIPYIHAENTNNALTSWGADSTIYSVENISHLNTMIKHKYTGLRFIASVILKRPEIYRPLDTENQELIQFTKRRMNPEDIEPIVPPRNSTISSDDNDVFKNNTIKFSHSNFIIKDKGHALIVVDQSAK